MQSIARTPDTKNNNMGYHERRIPVSRTVVKAFLEKNTDKFAKLANERIEHIAVVGNFLKTALFVLFHKPAQITKTENDFLRVIEKLQGSKKKKSPTEIIANPFIQFFESQCDAYFFDELIKEVEMENSDAIRTQWLCSLALRAEKVLVSAFTAGPRSGQFRYRSQSAALIRLHKSMQSDKFPLLASALQTHTTNSFYFDYRGDL